MREILFRGKRIDNGEWVEGAFLNDRDGAFYICPAVSDISYGDNGNRRRIGCWYKVAPSTVGQFTGLCDKNWKKIFEGDVVSLACGIYRNKGIVKYFEARTRYGLIDKKYELFSFLNNLCINQYSINIIGNIHDNPELLEG